LRRRAVRESRLALVEFVGEDLIGVAVAEQLVQVGGVG
jgi:hypothetical protein